jgi:hypothetical protein
MKSSKHNERENTQSMSKTEINLTASGSALCAFPVATSCPSYWWNEDKYLGSCRSIFRLIDGFKTVAMKKKKRGLKNLMIILNCIDATRL